MYDAWGNCLTTVHDVNATGIRGSESVPLETLEKICAVLDCTLDDIVEFSEDDAEHSERGKQNGKQ